MTPWVDYIIYAGLYWVIALALVYLMFRLENKNDGGRRR